MKRSLFNYPKFKQDVHCLKTKMTDEFLLNIDNILSDLKISFSQFEELGHSLFLKDTFDYALFFGVFEEHFEICDKSRRIFKVYILDLEETKENISFIYNNYNFLI